MELFCRAKLKVPLPLTAAVTSYSTQALLSTLPAVYRGEPVSSGPLFQVMAPSFQPLPTLQTPPPLGLPS